jgi:DNA polymerase III delta subunit
MLRKLLLKAAGGVRFTPEATRILLERLGFAPRLLIQEGRKLAAASVEGVVEEELVLALSFPRERSLDAVRDAVFERRAAPILDIMAATEAGIPVRDRQGRAVTANGAPHVLLSQVASIVQNLLYLRRLAAEHGLVEEMATAKTRDDFWYPRKFKDNLGPKLLELIKADAPSPIQRSGGKAPTLFALGRLFKGTARFSDDDLLRALGEAGAVEAALRGEMASEALSVWLTSFLD